MDFLILYWLFGGRRKRYVFETEAEREIRLKSEAAAWQSIFSFFSNPGVKWTLMALSIVLAYSFSGNFLYLMGACTEPSNTAGYAASLPSLFCN